MLACRKQTLKLFLIFFNDMITDKHSFQEDCIVTVLEKGGGGGAAKRLK